MGTVKITGVLRDLDVVFLRAGRFELDICRPFDDDVLNAFLCMVGKCFSA